MDHIEAMRTFARVVDRGSFAQAARDLRLSRSKASDAVRQLEARLGAKLLERTTRMVTPTPEGEAYHRRCLKILADLDDAESGFSLNRPRGPLRVDAPGELARHFLVPGLNAFLGDHPEIDLHLGEGDRLVDLVREGVDLVIRVGVPAESSLVARRVAMLEECTLASPAYLAAHGCPRTPDELDGHRMIGFVSSLTGSVIPLEFTIDGETKRILLPTSITVSSAMMNAALAREGFGLIQVPRYRYVDDIAAGRLVEVMPGFPPSPSPVMILYPDGRLLASRARAFIDWAAGRFSARHADRA